MIIKMSDYGPGGEVRSDYAGYSTLARLASLLDDPFLDTVEIDWKGIRWFEANMAAPLGAVLQKVRSWNEVANINMTAGITSILARNGFLVGDGTPKQADPYNTAMAFTRFRLEEGEAFQEYVSSNLAGKDLPAMTRQLRRKFLESLCELFENAKIHSGTRLGVFACGQHFPTKHRLDLAVCDLGIGICNKVQAHCGVTMSPCDAIQWAFTGRNTTRNGDIPGGLGLKMLEQFITKNNGRLHVVSNAGYREISGSGCHLLPLPAGFPGTIVNVSINTADHAVYYLAEASTNEVAVAY
ncbi:MAG: ATP-binding protein [Chloroflexota bacterium]